MFHIGRSAIVSLLLVGGMALATEPASKESDQQARRQTMEEMRKELDVLRQQMKEHREEVRKYAGDPPEALRRRDGRTNLLLTRRVRTR